MNKLYQSEGHRNLCFILYFTFICIGTELLLILVGTVVTGSGLKIETGSTFASELRLAVTGC